MGRYKKNSGEKAKHDRAMTAWFSIEEVEELERVKQALGCKFDQEFVRYCIFSVSRKYSGLFVRRLQFIKDRIKERANAIIGA